MIIKTNLKEVLTAIGYMPDDGGKRYVKKYPAFDCAISVDFEAEKISYPEDKGMRFGRYTTTNFEQPENFVVLECVTRLLDKGYRPENIVLEKEWKMGHLAKSGFADILVTDPEGKTLFIIECKTAGVEYKKACKEMQQDGGQLFSYWQQEKSCRWLILYASDWKDGRVVKESETIRCADDVNIRLLAEKDPSVRLYETAGTTAELHEIWQETYGGEVYGDLIFAEDTVAYRIGVKPLCKKDLRDFAPEDKIVNRFEEILRHNNVSDKENAFNRLIALFICKLVDETTKQDDDEVEFQYKQGTDTYETLQDRLQRLHRDGMQTFMGEKIYYVSANYPEWLFSYYTGAKREKAIEDLQNTIRILKFYTNNDFAFKDVHNEELFYQNGKILVEMVQLFEKYRIIYPSKHQFLGDLFEQLLNKGFKQNEGQFFTPMPITRFIWDALPLARMVKSARGVVYPKIIDYACGAGHFLTEAVEAVNAYAEKDGAEETNDWVRDALYGIEKDYRLARVAKISLFMNGAGEGNIIFGDGLENTPEKGIENGAFDILVANPPYSVKDFKQHLRLKNNTFTLMDRISLSGSEIETLFVERIAQLLKPCGIAAVILPSSILSNDSASYMGAREQILRNFKIRAIVAFGSKTFGATGTNTVVLFLEKYHEPPKQIDLSADAVDAVFSGAPTADWLDSEIFAAYLSQIEVAEDTYRAFLRKTLTLEDVQADKYFSMYEAAFAASAELQNLQKSRSFATKSAAEQMTTRMEKFYAYAHAVEREKFLYFSLVYRRTTVIITAPADNKAQKDFLGYDWSNRKGNEGIQILRPGGELYCDEDRKAKGTIAGTIRDAYEDKTPHFTDKQASYAVCARTADLLDFSRVTFNKAIHLKSKKAFLIQSKYPIETLEKIAKIEKGTAITAAKAVEGSYKVVAGGKTFAYMHNQYNREPNVITVSASGAAGFVNFWDERIFASDCTTVRAADVCETKYIYYFLKSIQEQIYDLLQKGSAQPHVYPSDIAKITVPYPPKEIIEKIVSECEKVEEESRKMRKTVEEGYRKIEEILMTLDTAAVSQGKDKISLADNGMFSVSIGKRVLNKELSPDGKIPVYSANVREPFGYTDKRLLTDFSVPSVLWGIDGDWMVSYIREDKAFYPTDHCGVLRVKTEAVHPRYLAHVLEREGKTHGFSRAYRASIDRVQGITFTVPDRKAQDEAVAKIEEWEQKIQEAEEKAASLSQKIPQILEQYLK